jgi:hypothetical protein
VTDHRRCYECRGIKGDPPCYRDGQPDAAIIAAAFVKRILPNGQTEYEPWWPLACADNACQSSPDLFWEIVLESLLHLKTDQQAETFSAGLPEDFVSQWGDSYIDRIENLAIQNARFAISCRAYGHRARRMVTSGSAFKKLTSSGPTIDAGDPLPPI